VKCETLLAGWSDHFRFTALETLRESVSTGIIDIKIPENLWFSTYFPNIIERGNRTLAETITNALQE